MMKVSQKSPPKADPCPSLPCRQAGGRRAPRAEKLKGQNPGFSLIEVIIALALVLVTVIIFGVALSSLPLTKAARNQNLAYHIAAKKMEELRNTSFAALPPGGGFTDPGLSALTGGSADFSLEVYEGSSDIKKATVTVTWLEDSGPKEMVLETLMSKHGLNQP